MLIIGAGVQARAHAAAIPRVRPIREIRVVGRNPQKAARLAAEITQEQGIKAFACEASGANLCRRPHHLCGDACGGASGEGRVASAGHARDLRGFASRRM